MSADAHHLTAPPADGDGVTRAMRAALDDAALTPDRVRYINAHATSTPLGDAAEALAIQRVFGQRRGRRQLHQVVTGHLLGGAGRARSRHHRGSRWRDQQAPPTVNLDAPTPTTRSISCRISPDRSRWRTP